MLDGSINRCGRDTGYPAPPHADPGVRYSRTGLLNDTRFRDPYHQGRCYSPQGGWLVLSDPAVSGTSFL